MSTHTAPTTPSLPADPGVYRTLRKGDEERLRRYVAACLTAPFVGVDTETTGFDVIGPKGTGSEVVGVSLSIQHGQGIYVPYLHSHPTLGVFPGQMAYEDVAEILAPLWAPRPSGNKLVFHNYDFDARAINKAFGEFPADILDTSLGARILSWGAGRWDPKSEDHGDGSPRSLKNLTEELCGYAVIRYEEGYDQKDPFGLGETGAPRGDYAAADASNTLGIFRHISALLAAHGLGPTFQLECKLAPAVARIHASGILIDEDYTAKAAQAGDEIAAKLRKAYMGTLSEKLGREVDVNLDSTKQLQALFFSDPPEGLGFPVLARSEKTGAPKLDKHVLNALAVEYPFVSQLLEYRRVTKQLGTYLKGLPGRIYAPTGRVHARFNALGTATGRFSSSNPNLQNLTARLTEVQVSENEVWRVNIRDAIIAPPGHYLFDADYAQVEYRAMAGEAREASLIEGFTNGEDAHAKTASIIFNVPLGEVTDLQRQRGKTMNFALLYGQGDEATADALGVPLSEAQAMTANYFDRLPAIRAWAVQVVEEAVRSGYSVTPFGRRRWLPEIHSSIDSVRARAKRQAVNAVIQGGCADVVKVALIRLDAALREAFGDKVHLAMTVHDSITAVVHESVSVDAVAQVFRDSMEFQPFPHWPPLSIDCKAGYRYGSMVHYGFGEAFEFPASREPTQSLDTITVNTDDEEAAQVAAMAPPSPSTAPPRPIRVSLPEVPVSVVEALIDVVRAHPGTNVATLHYGGAEFDLPGTSLTASSVQWLSACSPHPVQVQEV